MRMVTMGRPTPREIFVRMLSPDLLGEVVWTTGSIVFERSVAADAEFVVLTALENPARTVEVTSTTLEVGPAVKLDT